METVGYTIGRDKHIIMYLKSALVAERNLQTKIQWSVLTL